MKRTFLVLTAALATVAFAPRSNAQGTNKNVHPNHSSKEHDDRHRVGRSHPAGVNHD